MIEHPRADELIEAVAGWVESIRPQLNPRDAFLSRVAVNALNAVKRELIQGPAAEAAAAARLSALLGVEGDLKALNAELCERLRRGEMDVATPGLIPALKAGIEDQIAIDQPSYVSVKVRLNPNSRRKPWPPHKSGPTRSSTRSPRASRPSPSTGPTG
ncbi:DUF6285 domain-containing protein [Phenylobacterium sp.]|uniref:DUF6285 domain-containing protein n=1 Tax=Phenylobacterium sp. TaxID=1871053 RepID=UPI0025EDE729|nr:DUF6285 domain-containing protein [Phenylobacterium sp.]MCA6274863.1 protein kinase [Phenylobacterium sp.]